jgi:hypothetical protein
MFTEAIYGAFSVFKIKLLFLDEIKRKQQMTKSNSNNYTV